MEKLLGFLSLAILLRYFLSGAAAVLSALITIYGFRQNAIEALEHHGAISAAVSIFVGSLIYGLHRSYTNPFIDWLRFKHLQDHQDYPDVFEFSAFYSDHLEMTIQRWEYAEKQKGCAKYLSDWADGVHSLYTTALGLIAGNLFGWFLGVSESSQDCRVTLSIFFLAALSFGAGWISDVRRHKIEKIIYAKAENEKNNTLY